MDPDGWIELTLKVWPWPGETTQKKGPYKVKVHFYETSAWSRDCSGVRIIYKINPQENLIIPWWNIVAIEYKCNSDEYVDWRREQREKEEAAKTVEEGFDYAAEEIR